MHPQERHRIKDHWKQTARFHYRSVTANGSRSLPPGIVQVHIPFKAKRRRDPHNYCGTVLKAIIDGLVVAGAWPDDTPEWVGHREPILTSGSLCRVVIFPAGENGAFEHSG